MTVYVDHTHLGRRVTGIERITTELFSQRSLAPVELTPVTARGNLSMMMTQTFGLTGERLGFAPGEGPTAPMYMSFMTAQSNWYSSKERHK